MAVLVLVASLLLALLPACLAPLPAASGCQKKLLLNNVPHVFAACMPMLEGATLAWSLNKTTYILDAAYTAYPEKAGGWVAWGISPTGKMPKASALVAYPGTAGAIVVRQFKLGFYKTPDPAKMGDLTVVKMSAYSLASDNSQLAILFSLQLNSTQAEVNQIWGRGPDADASTGHLGTHQPSDNHGGTINFLTGVSTAQSNHQEWRNIHATLSGLGWGVLLPIGTLFPRYIKPFADPLWYYAHMLLQVSGVSVGIAGYVYGLNLWDVASQRRYTHFNLGLIIVICAGIQATAFLRPDKKSDFRIYWNLMHWASGYTCIILSAINIFIGFHILVTFGDWRTNYIIFLACYGAFALIMEVVTWIVWFSREKEVDDEEQPQEKP